MLKGKWRQLAIGVVFVAVAAFAWVRFFPGAPEILAGMGLGGLAPASTSAPKDGKADGGNGQKKTAAVITAKVTLATINDRLSAIGTGRANASVSVKPFSAGRLTEVLVQAGAHVQAGAPLVKLDSEVQEIALDRAKLALDNARAAAARTRALRSSNAATVVQLSDAELAVQNAELAVRDADLTLTRRTVIAPISGIVGILPVELGNFVTTDTEIAVIDDRSSLIVDLWAPERFSTMLKVGDKVTAAAIARPDVMLEGEISAIDNRLDEKSRTLLAQARIPNAADVLRAGMSFQINMRFPGDSYPAVDPLAIQWGADGAFVWTVRDGVGRRVPVRIVQRNAESVLVAGDITVNDQVVTEGVHLAREGEPILVAGNQGDGGTSAGPKPRSGSGS